MLLSGTFGEVTTLDLSSLVVVVQSFPRGKNFLRLLGRVREC